MPEKINTNVSTYLSRTGRWRQEDVYNFYQLILPFPNSMQLISITFFRNLYFYKHSVINHNKIELTKSLPNEFSIDSMSSHNISTIKNFLIN